MIVVKELQACCNKNLVPQIDLSIFIPWNDKDVSNTKLGLHLSSRSLSKGITTLPLLSGPHFSGSLSDS